MILSDKTWFSPPASSHRADDISLYSRVWFWYYWYIEHFFSLIALFQPLGLLLRKLFRDWELAYYSKFNDGTHEGLIYNSLLCQRYTAASVTRFHLSIWGYYFDVRKSDLCRDGRKFRGEPKNAPPHVTATTENVHTGASKCAGLCARPAIERLERRCCLRLSRNASISKFTNT